ncbi:glycoside hydrolase family 30 beta sandwich domain-containing protein [Pedobacter aquatilis]|uniref:glycoside hydrolase family 30 protein n=1 Tax=Pedobacter aquatilis TaxID=351343 RepID=UPI0025B5D77C|nr:glycoside hydrolase family 30 beta sandwich domain-containing protein [Pedobacter aquatilis]MDN3585177.1 glycoside hydrolase family 30 beta sandwich domain-containing protein [Pedobacter aquatilis]
MKLKAISYCFALILGTTTLNATAQNNVTTWLTKADRSVLFTKQNQALKFSATQNNNPTIIVNEKQTYQPIDGFGYSLTGGSAQHIIKMSAPARAALLKELFATDGNNIGVSYIRLSIGASDLNEKVFSYNDLPEGETDLKQEKFDLALDKADVIPVMKEILTINPKIKILGSPWSPPLWMKTTYDARGGMLKPEFYDAYAKYLVKYVQEMKKQGIDIDAITVQNEPLHPGNNPSLLMVAPDQAIFVKQNLGPALKKAGLNTKIIIYDHNADRPDYPITILDDKEARKYIDGSAFHLYGGNIEALTDVHNAHPDKNIYFTEQMVTEKPGSSTINIINPVSRLIIGATRNWARNVLEWNLAADSENKPFTDRGGCPTCQGAVTIDKDVVSRNIAYYSVAHASKFVRPGSVRIASNETANLPNVAFKTPNGLKVLIVANTAKEAQNFNISFNGKLVSATLGRGDVATYTW